MVYFEPEVAKQYGVGRPTGNFMNMIVQQRLEKQKAAEDAAKTMADLIAQINTVGSTIGWDQYNALDPEQQAMLANGGAAITDPVTRGLFEQIQSGDVPASLRSPELKLARGSHELYKKKTEISASEGGGGWNWGDVAKGAGNVLSRAGDILSRPVYGVMAGVDNMIELADTGDAGEFFNADMLRGLWGTEKTTGSDVLRNALDIDDDEFGALPTWAKGAIMATGLAADIASDPLTYLGVGPIRRLAGIDDAVSAVTKGVSKVEAAQDVGKAAGFRGAIRQTLGDEVAAATDEAVESLGLRGTRTVAERGGMAGGVPFQPQDISQQAAVLADTEALTAATSAKAIEAAAVRAGGQAGERAASRASTIAFGRELPYEAAELSAMKKRDLLALAKSEGIDVLKGKSPNSVTSKTIISRLRADPIYKQRAATRAAEHATGSQHFKDVMFDASYRKANERMADLGVDRTFALKFQSPMGRKVWGTLELPGLTKAWDNTIERVISTKPGSRAAEWGRHAKRTFSRTSQLGRAVHSMERYSLHTQYGDTVESMKAAGNYLDDIKLKDLSVADNAAVYDALQRGEVAQLDPRLRDVADGFRSLEDMHAAERLEKGLLRDTEIIFKGGEASYVPLYFKGYVPLAVRRQIRKERIAGASLDQIFSNPKYSKYEKLVEKDIGKIVAMSARDHGERIARHSFWSDMTDRFFLNISKVQDNNVRLRAIKEAQDKGFVRLKSITDNIQSDDLHRMFGDLPIDDIYVPRELEDGLRRLASWQYADPDVTKLKETYFNIMRNVKLSLTMVNPGFHIRNLRGDIFLNLMDGVADPRRYRQAVKLLNAAGDVKYQNLPTTGIAQHAATLRQQNAGTQLAGLAVSPDAALRPTAHIDVSSMVPIRLGGVDMQGDEVLRLFNESGGRTGFTQAEIERAVGAEGSRSAWERAKGKAAAFSEYREEMPRLAHFIDKLDYRMKEAGVSALDVRRKTNKFKDALQRAGNDVRKFNIDYSDITRTETSLKNAAIPFYTWMRKNTALQLEMMFTRPAFAAGWSNAVQEAKNWMEMDPYGNEITPSWIDEMIGVPVGRVNNDAAAFGLAALGMGQAPFLGGEQGPMDNTLYMTPFADTPFANAMEPFEALATLFDGSQAEGFDGLFRVGAAAQEFSRFGANQLAPQIQIPLEQATGATFFSGGPAPSPGRAMLASELSPAFKALWNVASPDREEADTAKLWNWLLAANAQYATPQVKAGEVASQNEILDAIKAGMVEERLKTMGINPENQVQP